ncbi:MAG: hypothetical protein UU32_C0016G0006 [Candidatus Woesebacteria bacterium GW2011_GWB1_41_10]|uniref:Membrane protein 6-pyruvoyl-tetrahydropterin synthase-related domain-containing protein n=1 Tax=Candidatus Woesebacteria bacterium GW2011_GWB1_41_10 TaxID=1618577 RepID=A0A0G0UBP6_9BACT|nr:MAG: hypothetical protein UU32_C0016G0006 [Candidatus Woesebacteria bacterium GW2011_GWB1_41_10]
MKKILPFTFPLILVLTGIFLAFKNYTSGTFLIGWDSLHPEFNFSEAFSRVLNGVWRSEQGLGALAAHSHMADWPRIIILFVESFFLPASFLRYSYIFLCLVLGPLGVYFFIKYTLEKYFPAFLGGLYYLLNLGTLQHFFVPFEMFITQFAFLPWLFLFALKFLREGKKKNLIIFVFLTILSSPQAYAATLFYAYFGALSIFVLLYKFKKGVILILVTIFLNLYWILPNLYSVKNQSHVVVNSKINQLFSTEARLRSLDYANVNDILIHKNLLFGWKAFDFEKGQFGDLMGIWSIQSLYIFAALSLVGLIFSLFKKDKVGFSFLGIALYAVFFLFGGGGANEILKEALRMPFTKFSIILMFAFSYFFAYFFFKLFRKAFLSKFLTLIIAGGLVFSMLPMFQGELISPTVRRNIPNEYFELFDWFRGKEGRVAALPLNTLWGWDYHSWNYEGSGFLTYGLKNPLLVRDFDRWSRYNEAFYNEASYALYSENREAFANTMQKYQVKYLLLDESIINAGGSPEILFIPEIKQIVLDLRYSEVFRSGFLSIYDTHTNTENISSPTREFGSILPSVGPAEELIISESFGEGRGFPEGYNCDLKKLGKVYKSNLAGWISYRAEGGGVSCDFFDYPELKHNQAYVLRIKGENRQGRSLKVYLQNWEINRMDLEELLPEGKFDESFVIYPSATLRESEPTRQETSENVIEKIEFYNADTIRQVSDDFTWWVNNLKIGNVKKYGTAIYKVDVEGSGLMQLEQGSEEGWIAFGATSQESILATMRGVTLLDHVKINSWSNGWVVPPSIQYPVFSIYIVFWPQFLEWGGLILTGITILTLVRLKLY